MDFLFVELMLWARAEGYRYFNLGMAPLSGFEQRRLAPLWSRTGAFIYRHGEHFYNFDGLRRYKEKFAARMAVALSRGAGWCRAAEDPARRIAPHLGRRAASRDPARRCRPVRLLGKTSIRSRTARK